MLNMRAYDFIAERIKATSVAPTRRELGEALGCPLASAQRAVDDLVRAGLLQRIPGRMQALDLVRVQYFKFDDETKQFVEWRP